VSKKSLILAGAGLCLIGVVCLRFRPEQAIPSVPVIKDEQTMADVECEPEGILPIDDGLAPRELPPVDESIQTMIAATDYNRRLRVAVNDLPEQIGTESRTALETYLRTPQDGKDGDFRQHEYALRNYMMDALRADTNRFSETVTALIDVVTDRRQGDIMRGYALQHLCSVYRDNPQALPKEDKQRIIATFSAALNETEDKTVAPTALVGLHAASLADPAVVSGPAVESAALKLISNPESGTLSKISAFQICGERKTASVAQAARTTALDQSADWVLRMSAVYALGQLGQTAELEPLLNDSDKNVSHAARLALNAQR